MAKFIKCPDCGHVFKSPAMDYKMLGFGLTLPGLGVIKCPECKLEKRRKYFSVTTEEESVQSANHTDKNLEKHITSEKDLIDDSKFEDE